MSKDQIYILDDYATLDLVEEDSDSATPVAGIQDVTIEASQSIETLYTADSAKVSDKFGHEHVVNVEIGYSFFDGEVVAQYLGGDGGTTATSWEDSSDLQHYELTGTFEARDGSQQIEVTITGITFESMPIMDAARGEYAQWDLSGEGIDITNFEVVEPGD